MKEYLEVITIPVLSPEQTACCGNGIPFLDITAHNGEAISITFKDVGYTVDDMRPPFAIETQGISMSGWGIQNGSRVVINPAEEEYGYSSYLLSRQISTQENKVS